MSYSKPTYEANLKGMNGKTSYLELYFERFQVVFI